MRITKLLKTFAVVASVGLVSSCGYFDHLHQGEPFIKPEDTSVAETTVTEAGQPPALPGPVGPPPQEAPVFPPRDAWDECPYLDTNWVAETNGQRVTGVGLDTRFDVPACIYWSYPDAPQLQVIVRHFATEQDAIAMVDHFAPVSDTSPASKPEGWSGGRGGWDTHSVYAVSKGDTAVAVISNQGQSVKAEVVALEAIKNLKLDEK